MLVILITITSSLQVRFTKAVEVQEYDSLTEKDLIGKIVNKLLASEKPLE
jgi:hypothetical protein